MGKDIKTKKKIQRDVIIEDDIAPKVSNKAKSVEKFNKKPVQVMFLRLMHGDKYLKSKLGYRIKN